MVDSFGVVGAVLHYGLIIAMAGTAVLLFIFLWHKKALDMDETPKYQMLKREERDADPS